MARRQKSSAGSDEDAEQDPKPEKKADQKLDEPKQAAALDRTEADTKPISTQPSWKPVDTSPKTRDGFSRLASS